MFRYNFFAVLFSSTLYLSFSIPFLMFSCLYCCSTTGPEIWRATDGKVACIVAGVGTGGTITGCSRYLKRQSSAVRAVAVEPAESAVLSGKPSGPHVIQGIGAGFVPTAYDAAAVDEVLPVPGPAAKEMARRLATEEGMLVGISAGAAVCGAIEVAKREDMAGKTVCNPFFVLV